MGKRLRRAQEVEFAIDPLPAGMSRQRWLYGEIRNAILNGRLKAGARLPASRDLARHLGVARGTVIVVFDQLAMEGYLIGATGRGTFVAARIPEDPTPVVAPPRDDAASAIRLSARGIRMAGTPFDLDLRSWPPPAFRPNVPDVSAFPFDLWHRIAARRSRLTHMDLLSSGEALGFAPLRQAISDHLRQSRGIACGHHKIAIVGSTQQALDILVRLLLDPGEPVWIEDPGYHAARMVMSAGGARIVGVPVDQDGIDVAAGRRLAPGARLAYVTAGRQAPLGMPLALARRLELLAWAEEAGAILIEDDYDSEFRFHGAPLAALKSHDRLGRVVYIGAFSKTLFPGLRLAFVVLPDGLVDPFSRALSLVSRHQPIGPQAVLHDFIAEGHFGRHLRRMRLHYGERAEILQQAAARRLGGVITIPPISMGLDTAAFLPPGTDDAALARQAAEQGLEVYALSEYAVDRPAPAGFRLGFAAIPPAMIEMGVTGLARLLDDHISSR